MFSKKKFELKGNALSSHGHDNGTRLSFDLSEVSPNTTQSLMSELHIYKRRVPGNYFNSNLCIITIYAITVVDGYVLKCVHNSIEKKKKNPIKSNDSFI